MTLGGLFSGIGGFELAAQWAGITPVWSNEIDPFCCKVLRKNFSHEIIKGDIRDCGTGRKYNLPSVDIVAGGFPCQPFSRAGKGNGKKDPRYLWPEMLRVIKEVGPKYVVGENVYRIAKMVLPEVLDDLEDAGYFAEAYHLPAYAVGAFHNRDRIWIIGIKANPHDTNANGIGLHQTRMHIQGSTELRHKQISLPGPLVSECVRKGTDSRVFRDLDGIPDRVDRIKSVGNAIVPQEAQVIFEIIQQFENSKKRPSAKTPRIWKRQLKLLP